jgi:hypothetical protein
MIRELKNVRSPDFSTSLIEILRLSLGFYCLLILPSESLHPNPFDAAVLFFLMFLVSQCNFVGRVDRCL